MARGTKGHICEARKRPRGQKSRGTPARRPAPATCLQPAARGLGRRGGGAGPSAAASPWQRVQSDVRGRMGRARPMPQTSPTTARRRSQKGSIPTARSRVFFAGGGKGHGQERSLSLSMKKPRQSNSKDIKFSPFHLAPQSVSKEARLALGFSVGPYFVHRSTFSPRTERREPLPAAKHGSVLWKDSIWGGTIWHFRRVPLSCEPQTRAPGWGQPAWRGCMGSLPPTSPRG